MPQITSREMKIWFYQLLEFSFILTEKLNGLALDPFELESSCDIRHESCLPTVPIYSVYDRAECVEPYGTDPTGTLGTDYDVCYGSYNQIPDDFIGTKNRILDISLNFIGQNICTYGTTIIQLESILNFNLFSRRCRVLYWSLSMYLPKDKLFFLL